MQGSIRKRVGKKGITWTAVVDLPPDPLTGKRRQTRISAATKKQAEELAAKTLHEVNSGSYIETTKLTVGEWLKEWFAGHDVRESSRIRYERDLRLWLIPQLGHILLAQLRASHIQAFYQKRLAAGAAPPAIRTHAKILRMALGVAARQRLIFENVARYVPAPKSPPPTVNYWTRAEMVAFLAISRDDPQALLYEVALKTGMRRGELLALRWSDINLKQPWLSVQRTLTRVKGGYASGDVKAHAGRRRIQLSAPLAAKLQARQQAIPRRLGAGPPGEDEGLVFTTAVGTMLDPKFINVVFQRLLRQVGARKIRFHDLRHTFATLALADGAQVKVVSAQLGHASIAVTMNCYAHVIEDISIDVADLMEQLGAVS
jgi:integrase